MLNVSVIVPNYNNEKYLSHCLDSILRQTYPIKQIVVYDDASTDGSMEIIEHYAKSDSRIQAIYGKVNVGVSIARDIAIKHTSTDYVCMLDADDMFFDEKKIEIEMQKVQEIYEQTGRYVVVFSQTVDVDEAGVPFSTPKHINLSGKERFRIVTRAYNKYMPRDYCFPRDAYMKCGGYTKGLSLYEDWELNIKLLEVTDFVYSGTYGTAYRHKENGLSSVDYKRQFKTKRMIFKKYNMSIKEIFFFNFFALSAYFKNRFKKGNKHEKKYNSNFYLL